MYDSIAPLERLVSVIPKAPKLPTLPSEEDLDLADALLLLKAENDAKGRSERLRVRARGTVRVRRR